MGVEPIKINSALVQFRIEIDTIGQILFGIEQPEQRGKVLKDILEQR